MIFNKNHFPFLLLFFIFFSCKNEKEKKPLFNKMDFNKLIELGQQNLVKQKFDSAFYYYNCARETCHEQEADRHIYILVEMAKIQKIQADFIGAEETATQAFPYIKDCKDLIYVYSLYSVLAVTYKELRDDQNALLFNNMCLKGKLRPIDAITIKNNLAVIYLDKKDFQKSQEILNQLLQNEDLKSDKYILGKVIDNLGYAYFKLNNPNALNYLNQGLKIRDSLKDDFEITPSLIHLSEYYENKNSKLAYEYALKAYQAATRINNPDDRLVALDFLIKNSSENEFKKYYSIHSSLRDSLLNTRQTAKNQFAKIKYDSTKAIENEQKYKDKMQIALLIAVVVVLTAFFIIYYIRKRNRKKLVASVYETESRIAKKIHDELANDVYQAMAFAETQNLQKTENKEVLMDNLENIYAKARDISQTNAEIYIDERYSNFLLDLINSFNSTHINIIVKNVSTVDWNKINTESKIALYRVIQELLVNMKKYSEANLVMLNFEASAKLLEIKYSDNGKGIDTTKFSKKGLQNAENRIQALKGTFTFDKEVGKGFRVNLVIPK